MNVIVSIPPNRRNIASAIALLYYIIIDHLSKPMCHNYRCYFFLFRDMYDRYYCRYCWCIAQCWKFFLGLSVAHSLGEYKIAGQTRRKLHEKKKIRRMTHVSNMYNKRIPLDRSRCSRKISCGLGKVTCRGRIDRLPSRWPGSCGIPD